MRAVEILLTMEGAHIKGIVHDPFYTLKEVPHQDNDMRYSSFNTFNYLTNQSKVGSKNLNFSEGLSISDLLKTCKSSEYVKLINNIPKERASQKDPNKLVKTFEKYLAEVSKISKMKSRVPDDD